MDASLETRAWCVGLLGMVAGSVALFQACARTQSVPQAAVNDDQRLAAAATATQKTLTITEAAPAPVGDGSSDEPGPLPIEAADERCSESATKQLTTLSEPRGPLRYFSVHGYSARSVRVARTFASRSVAHCITVAWPSGDLNSDGQPCTVARAIDDGWLRAIENTVSRIPWQHVRLLKRIVIDNRPTEHGIAAFDRDSPDDARDGRTIWLHERLFREPNHWARGNYGVYFSYHANEDRKIFDNLAADHLLFSPVLLHEIGHLVMYHAINQGPDRLSAPPCAQNCEDAGDCNRLSPLEREANCISPYCVPFRFHTATENWAEQYRFYYQSSMTRALLERAGARCLPLLVAQDRASSDRHLPPWQQGLPDMSDFRPSLWDSCGGRACKAW